MMPDPMGQDWSPYMAMGNNPIMNIDPNGMEWYTNWFGGQKWIDGDLSWMQSKFWNMNIDGVYMAPETRVSLHNNLNSNSRINWNLTSPMYDVKFTKTFQTSTKLYNPLGETTITHFNSESIGNGKMHINYINENQVKYSMHLSFGIGSLSLEPNGISLSLGVRNNIELGFSTDGLTIGGSTKNNNLVHGTKYTWKLSKVWWSLVRAPMRIPKLIPIPL